MKTNNIKENEMTLTEIAEIVENNCPGCRIEIMSKRIIVWSNHLFKTLTIDVNAKGGIYLSASFKHHDYGMTINKRIPNDKERFYIDLIDMKNTIWSINLH